MAMDRSWMYEAPRPVLGGLFMTELAKFIELATQHAEREGRMKYIVHALTVRIKSCGRISM